MSENWRDELRAQQEELARLEAVDAELNENKISNDIDILLKRPVRLSTRGGGGGDAAPLPPSSRNSMRNSPPRPAADDRSVDEGPKSPTLEVVDKLLKKDGNEHHAPETADRLLRVKYTNMSKQLNEAMELRKKMDEQIRDQQRQLQMEREEKKSLQKRCLPCNVPTCSGVFLFFCHSVKDVADGSGAAQDEQAPACRC